MTEAKEDKLFSLHKRDIRLIYKLNFSEHTRTLIGLKKFEFITVIMYSFVFMWYLALTCEKFFFFVWSQLLM